MRHRTYDLLRAIFPEEGCIMSAQGSGWMQAWGNTVPSDAEAGYQRGCMFYHADSSELHDLLYVNTGSNTSAAFKRIIPAEAGSSSDPVTSATAGLKFLSHYFENSATSGDSRGYYLRHYLSGAGGGGEALRAYTTVNNVAGSTAHGAHISLSFGTSGSITGLGVGCRSTLQVPNAALTNGTYAGGMSEIYLDGTSSDISGTTAHSIHRFVVAGGDATARDKVVYAFEFSGIGDGTAAEMLKTDMHTGTPTDGLKVLINGAAYYISLVAA